MHLVLDGYGGSPQNLQNFDSIYELLDRYPSQIGMHKIMPPYVFKYRGVKDEDWGISGFVLIAESHISIHTFPDREYVNIDIFSCKSFDAEKAVAHLQLHFELAKVTIKILERGLEYPTDLHKAASIVRDERPEFVSLDEPELQSTRA